MLQGLSELGQPRFNYQGKAGAPLTVAAVSTISSAQSRMMP